MRMGCPFLGSGVCREEVVGAGTPVMQGRGLGGQRGKAPAGRGVPCLPTGACPEQDRSSPAGEVTSEAPVTAESESDCLPFNGHKIQIPTCLCLKRNHYSRDQKVV